MIIPLLTIATIIPTPLPSTKDPKTSHNTERKTERQTGRASGPQVTSGEWVKTPKPRAEQDPSQVFNSSTAGTTTRATRPAPNTARPPALAVHRPQTYPPVPGARNAAQQHTTARESSLRRRGAPTQAPFLGRGEVRRRRLSSSLDPGRGVVRRRSVLPPRPRARRGAQARLGAGVSGVGQLRLNMSGVQVVSRLLRARRLALTGAVSRHRGPGPAGLV